MISRPPPELRDAFGLWQHEGRHPLNSIHGYAQLLEREHVGSLTEQQHQAINSILTFTQRALEVWHRMSAYWQAQFSDYPAEAVNISVLLEELKRWLQSYPVELSLRVSDHLPSISGQEQHLLTALCYLLYPPDHPEYCTNRMVQLRMQQSGDGWLDTHVISALQVPTQEQGAVERLWYPGSCLNTAAIILQRHGSSITTSATADEMTFEFKLPIIPS